MAKQTPRKRRVRSNLPAIFFRDLIWDGPDLLPLWERHFNGDISADHAIFEHYAPMVRVAVSNLMRRRPSLFANCMDDMFSDGALGLLNAIRLTRQLGDRLAGFRYCAFREIRKSIFREMQTRQWGGRRGFDRACIINRVRGELTGELGRVPHPDELVQKLRGVITNVNLFIHGEPIMSPTSQLPDSELEPDIASDGAIDQRMIDAETVRMASRGMDVVDRKILKLLLKGLATPEIRRAMKLSASAVFDRLNGVLWQCRANAKLAEYLGIDAEPIEMPKRSMAGWKYPSFPRFDRAAG